MTPLTTRQREIFDFIDQRIRAGLPPTVREIGAEFGSLNPNAVACHLRALEKKGWITRVNGKSRNIRLVGVEIADMTNAHALVKEKFPELQHLPLADALLYISLWLVGAMDTVERWRDALEEARM